MHFVKVAGRAIDLDNVTHIEEQRWHDCLTVKLHFVGQTNNSLVLTEDDAEGVAQYVEYVAEPPVSRA
jgi:hypothetical protein